jgi:hypothetical protein
VWEAEVTVRVIRILEYVYESHEDAEVDMRRWNVTANGSMRLGGGTIHELSREPKKVGPCIITSATMMPRTTTESEEDHVG